MTISRITQKIHSKEANLWQIQKASEGIMPYAILHKSPEKRAKRTEILNREIDELKAERDRIKTKTPKEKWYPGRKNSGRDKAPIKNPATYLCSSGERVTQKEIDKRRSEAYKIVYGDGRARVCKGCEEKRAQGSAHSIPQAYAKKHGITETIWDLECFWPACHECNTKAENPKGDWETLKNHRQMLNYIETKAPELYLKFINKI